MRCKNCREKFEPKVFLQKFCMIHDECISAFEDFKNNSNRQSSDSKKKPIARVSKKRQVEQLKYSVLRIEFLGKPENKKCFIEGCNRDSNTIEHRAGRWGTNYLDTKTWAGCCSEHNIELEHNPELAKKYQLSKIHGGQKI